MENKLTKMEQLELFDIYCEYRKDNTREFAEFLVNHCNLNDTFEEIKEQLVFNLERI